MEITKLEVQGDVALRPLAALPGGATRIAARPLALGETSGHAHVVVGPGTAPGAPQGFDLFEHGGKTYVAVGGDGASLTHMKLGTGARADHDAIALAPNACYEVILQNEYNPERKAFERVLD